MVRRIFAAAAPPRPEICRGLNPTLPSHQATSTLLSRLLRNEASVGRVYFNRTESVPGRRPARRARQVPRDRADWIRIGCPPIVNDEIFEAAGRVAVDNTRWSPRRTEPGQWLPKGLVKCGVCVVGTNRYKMRGRNGTWHRYFYCRNHDPVPAGGQNTVAPNATSARTRSMSLCSTRSSKHCCNQTCCSPVNTPSPSPHRSPTTSYSPPNSPAWTAKSTPPSREASAGRPLPGRADRAGRAAASGR